MSLVAPPATSKQNGERSEILYQPWYRSPVFAASSRASACPLPAFGRRNLVSTSTNQIRRRVSSQVVRGWPCSSSQTIRRFPRTSLLALPLWTGLVELPNHHVELLLRLRPPCFGNAERRLNSSFENARAGFNMRARGYIYGGNFTFWG